MSDGVTHVLDGGVVHHGDGLLAVLDCPHCRPDAYAAIRTLLDEGDKARGEERTE